MAAGKAGLWECQDLGVGHVSLRYLLVIQMERSNKQLGIKVLKAERVLGCCYKFDT